MGKLSQRLRGAFSTMEFGQFEFPDGTYHALVTFDRKTSQDVLQPFKNYLGDAATVVNLDGSDVTGSTPTSDSRAKFYRIRVKMQAPGYLIQGANPIVTYSDSGAEVTHVTLIKPNEDPLPPPQTPIADNSNGDEKGYRMTNIANVAAILFGVFLLYQIYKGYKG